MSERHPFERQPEESAVAYHAFEHYRDMLYDRAIDRARDKHRTECVKTAPGNTRATHWQEWSTRFNWVERVQAYDDHLANQRRERRERQLNEALDQADLLAQLGLSKVTARLQRTSYLEIPVASLPQFIKTLTDLRLKALGYTEQMAIEHTGPGGEAMEISLPELQRILSTAESRWALDTLGRQLEE